MTHGGGRGVEWQNSCSNPAQNEGTKYVHTTCSMGNTPLYVAD